VLPQRLFKGIGAKEKIVYTVLKNRIDGFL